MTRVEDIQNRLSAATPGPWTLDRYDHGGGRAYVTDPKRRIVCDAFKENDREFLFNSASDLAYLLAELRKAREALGRVEEVAARLHWEADNANEGAKYAAEVNQGASLMALESERFAYQKAEHLIRAAVAAAKGDERG
jgi:hypothetical protein